jgi:apolipoprotein N-acyltransferase
VGIAVLPLLVLFVFGAWRLSGDPEPLVDGVKLRIVQASVDQRDKWKPEKQGEIFKDQLELSRHDASARRDDLAGITHLIWPEAAMPFLPLEHPEALAAIGALLPDGARLLSGALRLKQPSLTRARSRRSTTRSTSFPSASTFPSSRRLNGWGSSSSRAGAAASL